MTRRLSTFAIAMALALGAPALGVVGGAAPAACASTDQRAALVVDTGTQARSYCVALGASGVSGTDLIRLAHAQYGLDYRLGYGGRAVCRLAGVGVDGGDCFGAFPDYWGYWHGDDSGGWNWASGSAADWTVHPGDVEGWQWGPGQDGTTHAMPPPTTEEDVCPPVEPSPPPTPGSGGGGGSSGGNGNGNGNGTGGSQAAGSPGPTATATQHPKADEREPRDRTRGEATPTPAPSASPTGAPTVAPAAVQGPGSTPTAGGVGAGGAFLALAAVVGLGVAGTVVIRRRKEAS